ncbi:MAG: hypothetical protein ACOCZ5_01435 [bacterium]
MSKRKNSELESKIEAISEYLNITIEKMPPQKEKFIVVNKNETN